MTPEVKFMIEHFMQYHNEGKSVKEIAELCGIAPRTIYSYLGMIAKQNHVSRESLLQIPHKQHKKPITPQSHKQPQSRKKVGIREEVNFYSEQEESLFIQQEESPVIQQEDSKTVDTASLMNEYEVVLSRVNALLKVAEETTQKYGRN